MIAENSIKLIQSKVELLRLYLKIVRKQKLIYVRRTPCIPGINNCNCKQ